MKDQSTNSRNRTHARRTYEELGIVQRVRGIGAARAAVHDRTGTGTGGGAAAVVPLGGRLDADVGAALAVQARRAVTVHARIRVP